MSGSLRDELRPGDLFGGYEIIRRIGAGAFGSVYEATRRPLNKRVGLKVLHREHARDEGTRERFLREAQIVAQVEHPNIVSVFDVGVHDEQPYIVMELLDGEALADRLKREGSLPVELTVDLLLPVMAAMSTMHDKGIVHRDLKPDNIFLARIASGGTVPKLLDFGIAKVRDAERALTATSAIMGTPRYMSPEQAQESKHVDAQSDQWALAVIVFECLTGTCPYQGDNLLSLLIAITSQAPPRLCALRPDLPAALEAVLLRAMERAPADRWPSVRGFGEALLPFASPSGRVQWEQMFAGAPPLAIVGSATPGQTAAVAGNATLAPATRSSLDVPRRSKRYGLMVVFAVVAVVVGGGAWFALRRPESAPMTEAQVGVAPPPPAVVPTVVAPAVIPPDAAAPAVAPAVVQVAPVADASVEEAQEDVRVGRHRSGRQRGHRRGGAAPAGEQSAFPNF